MWLLAEQTSGRSVDPPLPEGFLFSGSEIDRDLIQAYLETEYRVFGDRPLTLRAGEHCPALASLHARYGVRCSAFLTACNPYSVALDDAANAARQAELAHELVQHGLAYVDGIGLHSSGQWPGEASYLALGLRLDEARLLGARLEQNAIVWSDADAVPQLILLR